MKRFLQFFLLLTVVASAAVQSRALDIPAGTLYFDNSLTRYSNVKFVYGNSTNVTYIVSMTDIGDNIFKVEIPATVRDMYRYTFAETSLADGTRDESFTTVKDYISNTLSEKRTATSEAAITPGWIYRPTSGDNWAAGAWVRLDDKPYSGTLPVIFIDTENNAPIVSKEEYLNATYYIDPLETGFDAVGSKEAPLTLKVKGRGNYTWTGFDKKPYRLKLDKKAALLGMPKSKQWALLAHADDEHGFLRNTLGFELARRLGMEWTPGQQPIEVVLNGEYIGLYMLTELIKIEETRVNIVEQEDYETDAANITGGWLVEIDNYDEDEQVRFTEGNGALIRFTYKSPELLSDAQRTYLTDLGNSMNSAIYNNDKSSTRWEEIIDIDELAKFYLVQEILDNAESFHGSCYWHKDRGDNTKVKFGPVWDFGNTFRRSNGKFIYQDPPFGQTWIAEIAKYPRFQAAVKKYWDAFLVYDYSELNDVIDDFENYIAAAAPFDYERWPNYGSRNFSNARAQFKSLINNRVAWLKEQWGEPDYTTYRYDVNGDGSVNTGDVAAIYNAILDPDSEYLTRADVNADGNVNAGDVAAEYEFIINGDGGNNDDKDDSKYVTIYVKADEAPYLYAWTFTPSYNEFNGGWPGAQMSEQVTINNVQWWKQQIDADEASIIFNNGRGNGAGNQTENIEGLTRGAHYFTYDGADGYTTLPNPNPNPEPDPDPDPEPETNVAIYVQAPAGTHLYAWTSSGNRVTVLNGDWPGNELTDDDLVTVDDTQWYLKKFDVDSLNIIFNNSGYGTGNQTEDITELTRGAHYFTYDGADGYTALQSVE